MSSDAVPAPPASVVAVEERDDQPGVERLLSLSDGVVAIALTLLVLQLKVPSLDQVVHPKSVDALATALGRGGDQLVSYVVSFYVIAQFWLAHHRVFRHIAGHQEGLAWWNFAFLFTITIMPFASNLLGEYSSNPLAVDVFAVDLLLASLATQATLYYGQRKNLLIPGTDTALLWGGRARTVGVCVAVAVSIGVASFNTYYAKLCWLLIAILPWLANRWHDRRVRPDAGRVDPVAG